MRSCAVAAADDDDGASIAFHFDCDEGTFTATGELVPPWLSTVTYLGDEGARSRHARERRGVAFVEEKLRVDVGDGEHGDHLEREEERGAHPRVRLAEPKVGVPVEGGGAG